MSGGVFDLFRDLGFFFCSVADQWVLNPKP